jgi:dCMP deaminase
MFIALIGTPSSGKNTIAQYLISRHGFRRIGLADTGADGVDTPRDEVSVDDTVSMIRDSTTHLAETEYSWQT